MNNQTMENKEIEIIEKHPRAIRWMHWVNFPILALMIWSGILIYWANEAYIAIPESISEPLNLSGRLADGLGWHFFLMWIFAINGILYFLYLAISGEWRTLWPGRKSLQEALQVLLHDLHLRKEAPPQDSKFNAAQKIAYSGVIIMGGLSLLTGLAIYKPVQANALATVLGGYEAARFEHFILMIGFVLFFLVHISQVVKAGWNQFRAMVTGYEIKKH